MTGESHRGPGRSGRKCTRVTCKDACALVVLIHGNANEPDVEVCSLRDERRVSRRSPQSWIAAMMRGGGQLFAVAPPCPQLRGRSRRRSSLALSRHGSLRPSRVSPGLPVARWAKEQDTQLLTRDATIDSAGFPHCGTRVKRSGSRVGRRAVRMDSVPPEVMHPHTSVPSPPPTRPAAIATTCVPQRTSMAHAQPKRTRTPLGVGGAQADIWRRASRSIRHTAGNFWAWSGLEWQYIA